MLFQPWDSGTGAECAEGAWGSGGDCCGVWEVGERTDDAACNSNIVIKVCLKYCYDSELIVAIGTKSDDFSHINRINCYICNSIYLIE